MDNERKRKLLELEDFRRRVPHVTASALSVVIKELKRTGLPELDGRADIRAARDLRLQEPTPYGPISTTMEMVRAFPGQDPETLHVAHPIAFLWKAYKECDPFAAFLKRRLAEKPNSFETPWGADLVR